MEDGGWRGRWRRREHVQKSKESCIMCSRRELMNKMLQISSLDQQPKANHWIGNVTTTLTSLLSSSLTFNKPESPRTTPAHSVDPLRSFSRSATTRFTSENCWTHFSLAPSSDHKRAFINRSWTRRPVNSDGFTSAVVVRIAFKITLSFSRYTTTIMTTVKDTNTLHTLIININELGTQSAKRQWVDETRRMSRIHQRQKSWIYKANTRNTEMRREQDETW